MSNNMTQHTPADVRERVQEAWATVEAAALAQADVLDSHYGGQRAKAAEIRNAVEQVAALLRAGRGGGRSALWWAANELVAALEGRSTLTVQQCITGVKRLLAEADLRAPRGEGDGDALGMLQASVDEYLWEAQNNPQFDAEAAFAVLSREIRAARRSKAQGEG